jgi:hypothetical protein
MGYSVTAELLLELLSKVYIFISGSWFQRTTKESFP